MMAHPLLPKLRALKLSGMLLTLEVSMITFICQGADHVNLPPLCPSGTGSLSPGRSRGR